MWPRQTSSTSASLATMRKFAVNSKTTGIKNYCLPGSHLPLAAEHSVAMTELMIRLTRDVPFPESQLHIWKVMAMDDYLGCVDVVDHPDLSVEPDVLVYPLMGVDNNSTAASRLYSAMLLQAERSMRGWSVLKYPFWAISKL